MSGKAAKLSRRTIRRAMEPAMSRALDDHAQAIRDLLRRIKDLESDVVALRQALALVTSTEGAA